MGGLNASELIALHKATRPTEQPSTLQLMERIAKKVDWLEHDKKATRYTIKTRDDWFIHEEEVLTADEDVLLGAICADCRRSGWWIDTYDRDPVEVWIWKAGNLITPLAKGKHDSCKLSAALQAYLEAMS